MDESGWIAPQNVPIQDAMLLRLHNLRNVVKILTQLSREHAFTSQLIKPDGLIGARDLRYIEHGGRSEALEAFIREVAEAYHLDLTAIDDDRAMKEMIDRYRDPLDAQVPDPEDPEPPFPPEDPTREEWSDKHP